MELPAQLKKNLDILTKVQPRLASRLSAYLREKGLPPEPTLKETSQGRWVEGLGEKPFFEPQSTPGPLRSAKGVFLVYGLGYPPYLIQVLRSLPPSALSVVVVEPSWELLLHTLAKSSVYQALPRGCRISFLVDQDRALLDEAFAHNVVPLGIFPLGDAELVVHRGLDETRSDHQLFDAIKKEILYRLTMLGNSPEDTLLGVRHGALNTPRILASPTLESLKPRFEGKPFVCVAAGPSLDKNVEQLVGMEDRCVIVACDTVLLPLLRRGIRPHVVTSIERPFLNYEVYVPQVLKEFPQEAREILLVCQSVSHPLMAGRWPGPCIVVGKAESPTDRWLVGNILGGTIMISGMSVAHMAFSFASLMRASAIAFIGLDLAFSKEGDTHAKGILPQALMNDEKTRDRICVPGSLGDEVETNVIWLSFLQMFERLLSALGTRTAVSDCTEGGAYIEGMKIEPFDDYIRRECSCLSNEPIFLMENDSLEGFFPAVDRRQEIRDRIGQELDALNRVETLLEKIEETVSRAAAPALTPKRRQELGGAVADLLDECHRSNPVVSFVGQSYTHMAGASLAELRFLETVEQVDQWVQLHREMVEAHRVGVAFLRQWLEYLRPALESSEEGAWPEATEIQSRFSAFLGQEVTDLRSPEACFLSRYLCAHDLEEGCWLPQLRWEAARFLACQGRSFEARRIMKRAYEFLEGQPAPRESIATFFLDWARMLGSHDLCELPLYAEALEVLESVGEFSDSPDQRVELERLRRHLLEEQRDFLERFRKVTPFQDRTLRLLLHRNRAEEALTKRNLPEALRWVRSMLDEGLESYPGTCVPMAHWLLRTALDCRFAADPVIAKASREALDDLWSRRGLLTQKGFSWPPEMQTYLEEQGLQVFTQTADTQPVDLQEGEVVPGD